MVKRFVYMLALAFVLQMSAGIASAYCVHESGKASQHFGHHQHEHKAADGDDDGSSTIKKFGADPDCASCTHGSLVMLSWSSDVQSLVLSSHHQLAQVTGWPTPYLGLPERPNWIRAA
ncbi:MAG: hypothetical protein WA191_12795 [Telluria sp.]|nr:hypothetical protein [Telluria sp.]